MRIHGTLTPVQPERTKDASTPAAASTEPSGAVVVGARIEEVRELSGRHAVQHAERLNALAAALADGSYRVDPERLAAAIVREELSRGGVG
jgi:anti-sigma28 factor (negative regulator of flagellin synthesis)